MKLTTQIPKTNIPKTAIPRTAIPRTLIPKTMIPRTTVPRTVVPRVSNAPIKNRYYSNNKKAKQPQFTVTNYDDPSQINSFIDALYYAHFKNTPLKTQDFGWLTDLANWIDDRSMLPTPFRISPVMIPGLPMNLPRAAEGFLELMNNTVIKPAKQLDFKAAGINLAQNFFETADILANPVKGLVLEGPQGFVKGSVGRVNYDYNTGNWFTDTLLEMVSDPLNWISWGAAGATKLAAASGAKASIGTAAKSTGKTIFKEGLDETTQKYAKKQLVKIVKRSLLDETKKGIVKNLDDFFAGVSKGVRRLGPKYFDDDFIKALVNKEVIKTLPIDAANLRILRSISAFANTMDTAEKTLYKGMLYANFIPIDAFKHIKDIKQFAFMKNYMNKVAGNIGVAVTGLNTVNDVTNLANYKVITDPKRADIWLGSLNETLKQANIKELDAIQLDTVITERTIQMIGECKKAIQVFVQDRDFEGLINNLVYQIVPSNLIPDGATLSELYNLLNKVIAEDLELIKTVTKEDGFKPFAVLEKSMSNLQNVVKAAQDNNNAVAKLKKLTKELNDPNTILKAPNDHFIQKYQDTVYEYHRAYINAKQTIQDFTDDIVNSIARKADTDTIDMKQIQEAFQKIINETKNIEVKKLLQSYSVELKNITNEENLVTLLNKINYKISDQIKMLEHVRAVKEVYGATKSITLGEYVDKLTKKQTLTQAFIKLKNVFTKTIAKQDAIKTTIKQTNSGYNKLLTDNIKNGFYNLYDVLQDLPEDADIYLSKVLDQLDSIWEQFQKATNYDEAFKIFQKVNSEVLDSLENTQYLFDIVETEGKYTSSVSSLFKQYQDTQKLAKELEEQLLDVSNDFSEAIKIAQTKNIRGGLKTIQKISDNFLYKKQNVSKDPIRVVGHENNLNKEVIEKETIYRTKEAIASDLTYSGTPEQLNRQAKNAFIKHFEQPEDTAIMTVLKEITSPDTVLNEQSINQGVKALDILDETFIDIAKKVVNQIDELKLKIQTDPNYFKDFEHYKELDNLFTNIDGILAEINLQAKKFDKKIKIKNNDDFIKVLAHPKKEKITIKLKTNPKTHKRHIIQRTEYIDMPGHTVKKLKRTEALDKEIKANLIDNDLHLNTTDHLDVKAFKNSNPEQYGTLLKGEEVVIERTFFTSDLNPIVDDQYRSIANDLLTLVADARKELKEVWCPGYINKYFDAENFTIAYMVQDEKLNLLFNAFSSKVGIAFEMQEILKPNSILNNQILAILGDSKGKFTTPELRDAVQMLYNHAQQYRSLAQFITNITQDPDIPEHLQNVIFSTLMYFSNDTFAHFDIDTFYKQFHEKLNGFLYGVDNPRSLSVQNLLSEAEIRIQVDPEFKKRFAEFTPKEQQTLLDYFKSGETHQSADDATLQDMLIRLYMPEKYISKVDKIGNELAFFNKDGGRLYVADMETAGNMGTELSIKAMGSDEITVFKVAYNSDWELPQKSFLKKMFPGITDSAELKAKYIELYTPESAVNVNSKYNITFFNSEKEMLQAYNTYLNKLSLGSEIIMHNGAKFDFPTIRKRAAHNGIYLNSRNVKLSDSWLDLKNNLPQLEISSDMYIKIKGYLEQYLNEIPHDATTHFASPINTRMLGVLTNLQKLLESNKIAGVEQRTEFLNVLNNLKMKYFNLYETNNKITASLQDMVITKEFLQSQEGQNLLLELIDDSLYKAKEALQNPDLNKAQRKELLDYIQVQEQSRELAKQGIINNNISRLLYTDRMDGAPLVGTRQVINMEIAQNFFDDLPRLTVQQMNAITDFTRSMQHSFEAIRNIEPLIKYKQELAECAHLFITMAKKNQALSLIPFDHLRIDPDDFKTNFVIIQKLYRMLHITDIRIEHARIKEFADHISPKVSNFQYNITKELKELEKFEDIIHMLDESSEQIYGKVPPEFQIFSNNLKNESAIEAFTEAVADKDVMKLADEYDNYVKSYENITERGLNSLSNSIDETSFTSAFKFKVAQQVKPIADSVKSFVSFLKTLPDAKSKLQVLQKIEYATKLVKFNTAKQITELSDDDLLNFLLTRSMVVEFDTKFLSDMVKADDVTTGSLPDFIAKFLTRKDDLLKKGIEIDYKPDLQTITIYPNKTVDFKTSLNDAEEMFIQLNGKDITPINLQRIDIDDFLDFLPDDVRYNFARAQEAMDHFSLNSGFGTAYEVVDRTFYRNVYEQLPKYIKDNMLPVDAFMSNALFTNSRFNTTLIGSQNFCSMYGDYFSSNFIKTYLNASMTVASRASDKVNYIEMILNKDFSINNGFINELSFEDMRKMLKDSPEYNLACLVYNKSGKPELIDLKLNTKADFEFAKKNNAVILPYHVFATAYGVINADPFEGLPPVVEAWAKAMHCFKRGYLSSVGTIMRNVFDTFAKNVIIADGNIIEALSKTLDSMKLYMNYNATLNEVFKSSSYHRINKDTIQEYFSSGLKTKMTYEEFSAVHEVLNSGALVGEVKALDNYRTLSKARKSGINVSNINDLDDLSIRALNEQKGTATHLFESLMRVNNDIENIQRLSAYNLLREQGFNFTESVYRVAKDHFNYSMKTPREKLLELIIPFYTFKINNLQYWAEAFVDNPWILRNFTNIMTPVWNFGDYDQRELQYNKSLQYRILSGNIQLTTPGLTFKLNPSAADAMKLMTDPFGEIYNSTFAGFTFFTDAAVTQITEHTGNPVAEQAEKVLGIYHPAKPTKLDLVKSVINLVPYGAIAQRYLAGAQYAKELDNPLPAILPSMFGRVKQLKPYQPKKNFRTYKQYGGRGYGSSGKPGSSKRSTKRYRRKSYARKYYAKTPRYPEYAYGNSNGYNAYPRNFKKIYIDGMYTVPNISTYTAQANRYYHYTRLNNLPTVSIYDKLYTARGKSRWEAMLKPVTAKNLKYVIKNTIHYK